MTKTRIAKKAIHMVVALNVAAVVNNQVSNYLDLEDESITLEIGSFVAGQLVANQTDRVTEPAVDWIVNKWQSRKSVEVGPIAE